MRGAPVLQPFAAALPERTGRAVFVHELTPADVDRYRDRGASVICVEGDRSAITAVGAHRVGRFEFPDAGEAVEHATLIELTSLIAEQLTRRSSLGGWIERIYGSDAVDNFFKRMLLNDLDYLVAVAVVADRDLAEYERIELPPGWPNSGSWRLLLPRLREGTLRARAEALLGTPVVESLDRLQLLEHSSAVRATRRLASAVRHTGGAWVKLAKHARVRSSRFPPSRVVLRTYPSDWEAIPDEWERLKRVDYVVDGAELRPEDVLVWIEPGVIDGRRESLRKRGYRVIEAEDVRIGVGALLRRALPLLLALTARLPRLALTESWWHWPIAVLVRERVLWEEAARALGPTTFLAYNDISPAAVSRNLILQRHGIRTVFYQHSSGSYSELDGNWSQNMACAFLVFDAIAVWGPAHRELYAASPGKVGEFWDVGCLWSEHIRSIRIDPVRRRRYERLLTGHLPAPLASFDRVVAVIDGTVSSELPRRSWVALHQATLGLAEKWANVLFLVKPKFPIEVAVEGAGSEGADVVRKLESLANVSIVPSHFETSAVAAFADAVVGMPFTSVVIEALGVATPALYYDPIDQFPTVFWRRIPGMLATSPGELERRLHELLWRTTPEEYLTYLQTHLGSVEGHFDGLAITRLRHRLLERAG